MNDIPKDGERVVIFDTTLRDGEQSPGCSMNLEEKIQVADILERMGVDVIEAGFPIASEGDFEAVKAVAEELERSSVCGLARTGRDDVERAARALHLAQVEGHVELRARIGVVGGLGTARRDLHAPG